MTFTTHPKDRKKKATALGSLIEGLQILLVLGLAVSMFVYNGMHSELTQMQVFIKFIGPFAAVLFVALILEGLK